MRSFLATSNHQYVQDVVLKPGTYTYSALVKSSGSYSFALMIGGVWVKYDVPTSTTNWRKLKHTFTTDALATKFSLVADYASVGSPIEVLSPMFEDGSIPSTARMHELDVLEAIAIAKQEATDAAEALAIAKADLAETNAKAYADDEIDSAEARAIQAAQDKVDAQALVEQQARNVLQTNLEAYADGVVEDEEAARIADANLKFQAAKDYADAQANAAKVTAEAYADGRVDTEEQARIDDANAKLAEAKQHAEDLDLVIRNDLDDLTGTVGGINDRLSAEELAVIDLEKKTTWLDTDIEDNIIATGTVLIGNELSGTNAGISGLGTVGSSVRMWAGETFANRATSDWLMRDDGVEEQWFNGVKVRERGVIGGNYVDRLFNPIDGLMAKQTAIISGYITEQWYNNGVLVYEIGKGGIYYVSEIPESYTARQMTQASSSTASTIDATLLENIGDKFYLGLTAKYNDVIQPAKLPYNPDYEYSMSGFETKYLYQAGQNVYSESNKPYEGFKNTESKFDNITDGWWFAQSNFGELYLHPTYGEVLMFPISRIIGGKITGQASVLLIGNNDYELLTI